MTSAAITSGQPLFGARENAIYDVLTFLEPGLMLDIGAAAGYTTKLMLDRSRQSWVVAFEPFPGNIPYFRKTIGNDPRVTLVQKAVSNSAGTAKFYVPSSVKGTEPGWVDKIGYSSVGYLVADADAHAPRSIEVETCRIDDMVSERVRFMKIDVQGGEHGVLAGASVLLTQQMIDLLFVEFGGERDVLNLLTSKGYELFDSEYLLIPTAREPDLGEWDVFRDIRLSIGRIAHRAWPKSSPTSADELCALFETEIRKVGYVYTDMVCVSRRFLPQFLRAADEARSAHAGQQLAKQD